MGISYVTFLKHAAKVTKTVKGRPTLQGVLHNPDGSLAATDSHRLYFAENTYDSSEQVIKNPVTGEIIEGNYPEIGRLIPKEGEWFDIEVDVKQAVNALKAMLLVVKANNNETNSQVRLNVVSDKLIITAGLETTPLKMSYEVGLINEKKNEEIKAAVNVKYLYESLDLIRDLGFTKTTLTFYGNMRPFTISNKDITTLMLPVREV